MTNNKMNARVHRNVCNISASVYHYVTNPEDAYQFIQENSEFILALAKAGVSSFCRSYTGGVRKETPAVFQKELANIMDDSEKFVNTFNSQFETMLEAGSNDVHFDVETKEKQNKVWDEYYSALDYEELTDNA